MGLFRPAVKTESKLRMAISGPSGSGKTYTALAIATALAQGKPIALVDTEHGSASKYADLFTFDVAEMHPPFHPDKFVEAVQEAAAAGYAVIILDSLTHAWTGTGGVLDIVDAAARRSKSGNTYTAWKDGTPIHNRLIDGLVQSGVHVIGTMRSKTEYVLVQGERGQQMPKKVGMAPEQRQNFEYEFDVVLDMDIDHNGIVSKSRCPELSDGVFKRPGADVAKILIAWLGGAPAPAPQRQAAPTPRSVDTSTGEILDADTGMAQPQSAPATNGKAKEDRTHLNTLHALGMAFYDSEDEWDEKRPAMVRHISREKYTSYADLPEPMLVRLVEELETRCFELALTLANEAGISVDEYNELKAKHQGKAKELRGVGLAHLIDELRKMAAAQPQPEPMPA